MAQVPVPLFPLIEPDLWISHIRLSCKHFVEGIRAAIPFNSHLDQAVIPL